MYDSRSLSGRQVLHAKRALWYWWSSGLGITDGAFQMKNPLFGSESGDEEEQKELSSESALGARFRQWLPYLAIPGAILALVALIGLVFQTIPLRRLTFSIANQQYDSEQQGKRFVHHVDVIMDNTGILPVSTIGQNDIVLQLCARGRDGDKSDPFLRIENQTNPNSNIVVQSQSENELAISLDNFFTLSRFEIHVTFSATASELFAIYLKGVGPKDWVEISEPIERCEDHGFVAS